MGTLDLKKWLLGSTLLIGASAVAFAPAAYAQGVSSDGVAVIDSDDEDEADDDDQDTVVVTGSRIKRDGFSSASPIQVIDGELARDIGLIDAADLVQQSNVAQGQQIDLGLSSSAGLAVQDNISGPGAANLNLRGLNANRTLVLVNGRRLAPSGVRGAPSGQDVNLIPGSLIERVEILLDGASSIYSSDAVAGVANYILRSEFDGVEFDAFYTYPELGGGEAGQQQVYTGTFGVSNDRAFLSAAIEYSQIQNVTREQFGDFYEAFDTCSRTFMRGASGTIYDERCGNGTIGAGVLQSPFGFLIFDENANEPGLPPGYRRAVINAQTLFPSSTDLLIHPENQDDSISPDFRRTTAYLTGEYDLYALGNASAYFEGSYAFRETTDVGSGQDSIPIPGAYPLNPFNDVLPEDIAAVNLFFTSQVTTETDVDQSRVTFGLKGDNQFFNKIGDLNDWTYDGYISYSRSEGTDLITGLLAGDRVIRTLEGTTEDPNSGALTCDPLVLDDDFSGGFPSFPCFVADFFDPFFIANGRFEDEQLNRYFFPTRFSRTVLQQTLINGFTTGNLAKLPAGNLAAVIGFEFREDEIETQVDRAASGNELVNDFIDLGANGRRSLIEIFGEVEIPLIADKRLAEELTINLSGRWTEEENFGAQMTYKVNAIYAPTDWLTFRGTYGTSFRAPDVGEQFGSNVADFSSLRGAGDPCLTPGIAFEAVDSDNDPNTPVDRIYNPDLDPRDPELLRQCREGGGPNGFVGVDPTNFGVQGAGTNNLVFLGVGTLVTEGASQNLSPETSTASTAGFVIDKNNIGPLDAFSFSATYFDILIEDEVVELGENFIINDCYDAVGGLDTDTCSLFTRDANTGFITQVDNLLINQDSRSTRGVDMALQLQEEFSLPKFKQPFDFTLIGNVTRVLEQEELLGTPGAATLDDDLGEHGNPRWRGNVTGILGYDNWNFLWRTRYVDSTYESNVDPIDEDTSFFSPCLQAGETACEFYDTAEPYFVHDLTAAYRGDGFALRAGINNVEDEQPPLANVPFRGVGYDIGGRTYFFNVTKAF
ncbi:TonB-dependent receptor domain-containing protein [Parvularcula sp. IMCC14364]|uniref:TonB-dependent receptor domain-containing protein n=1 Tax=Parvularcula sp. IMCC14364 TaxID=3067902 RepID=UPI0027421286|nr:TonB-dependent receptor [Parvularcula sp. IMCC14364]